MTHDMGIAPVDLFRLTQMACSLAKTLDCSISEAIDRLEVSGQGLPIMPDAVDFARTAKRFRRDRDKVLGAALFRDPAWDMLLDLLVSDADGRCVSISSICLASGVPMTTALRHLDRLERHGFIVRHDDRYDHRRSVVEFVSDRKDDLLRFLSEWNRETLSPLSGRRDVSIPAMAARPPSRNDSTRSHPVFLS